MYAFSFSKELQDEWSWQERYPTQAEALAYLQHVADRFDMRRDIQFRTRMESVVYDEAANRWTVSTDGGDTYSCKYLVAATGVLSMPYTPPFPGIDTFEGESYVTGRWPIEPVDFTGKRIAVIGTGATAIQLIPIVAQTAAHVTVFQRTPNYVLPARNYPLSDQERQAIRKNYDEIWKHAREHFFGLSIGFSDRSAHDLTAAEQQQVLEYGWETGGFRYVFETFGDLLTDEHSNELASEFIRNKIRAIVHDPVTAELLCPKDYPFVGKRPPLGHFYYEAFNRDNVSLVDISENPITEITVGGLRTGTDEYAADVIIFATGFDAVTGTLRSLDIRGKGGVELREKWIGGPRTHLGISVDGFPNMFLICGPQTPFANLPVVIDSIVDWIGTAISHCESHGFASIEATHDAVEAWGKHMDELVSNTVLVRGKDSWFLGDNIPGKPHAVLFYFGGVGAYRQECRAAIDDGFRGFALSAGGREMDASGTMLAQPPLNLPGRLGKPDMSMRADPRADPRMLAGFAPFGLDQLAPQAPLDRRSPLQERCAYTAGFETQFGSLLEALFASLSPVPEVTSAVEEIVGVDGNRIKLYIHRPAKSDGPLPCIIHLHGGGMVMFEAAWSNYARWRDELAAAGTIAIGVEFRNGAGVLGPHPFPAGLDDCASAVRWAHTQRSNLGISTIVVSGESGGGNLTLATALKANREQWVDEIDGVYAQCPFISNAWGTTRPAELLSLRENDGYLLNVSAMDVLASVYDPSGENDNNPLCWPYHAQPAECAGLPPHVISVNELDPFRDEGLEYARMLWRAGVNVVSRSVGGTCHAGDTLLREALGDVYLSTIHDIASFARCL